MAEIQKVTTFFGEVGKTRQVRTFSRGSDTAEHICSAYDLKRRYGKLGNHGK
jgi:hypothetical protein